MLQLLMRHGRPDQLEGFRVSETAVQRFLMLKVVRHADDYYAFFEKERTLKHQ